MDLPILYMCLKWSQLNALLHQDALFLFVITIHGAGGHSFDYSKNRHGIMFFSPNKPGKDNDLLAITRLIVAPCRQGCEFLRHSRDV